MMAKKIKKKRKFGKETKDTKKKFKGRSQEVLKKIYDKKDERSRSQGKSIWRTDCPLPEFIPERNKDYELFIFPLGPEPEHGFYHELPIHTRVGPAFDAYICMNSYVSKPCFRCEDHARETTKWREAGGKKGNYPDKLKAWFPWDRAGYILLDMTSEESLEKGLQVWAAPKENVHAEIAKKMHSKKKGTFIDITDFSEGRIVMLEVGERKTEAGNFPTYSIDFEDLEEEVPEEYQDTLLELCEEAEAAGVDLTDGGLIGYLLHIPDYEEVKQSHLAGLDRKEARTEEEEEEEEEESEIDTDEIRDEMEDWSKFKIKKTAKERWGIELDTKGKEAEDVLEELVEELEDGDYNASKPKCFGEYMDHEECEECPYDMEDECADATEKAME